MRMSGVLPHNKTNCEYHTVMECMLEGVLLAMPTESLYMMPRVSPMCGMMYMLAWAISVALCSINTVQCPKMSLDSTFIKNVRLPAAFLSFIRV